MKFGVFLFAGFEKTHAFDYIFDSAASKECAFTRSVKWALGMEGATSFCIAVNSFTKDAVFSCLEKEGFKDKFSIVQKDDWNTAALIEEMARFASGSSVKAVTLAFGDCPFLNRELTSRILKNHVEYLAEYTFADGFPQGFAPEVVDGGTLNILASLVKKDECGAAALPVTKESLFSVIKTDINSFEIETVMAEKDWRMYRFDFSASSKASALSCLALCKALPSVLEENADVDAVAKVASECAEVQHTVPAYYNIQISSLEKSRSIYNPYSKSPLKTSGMEFGKFSALLNSIEALSEEAVVGLGTFSDPLLNPDFDSYCKEVLRHEGLSLLLETDAVNLLEPCVLEKAKELASFEDGKAVKRITWIVAVDAVSPGMYSLMHGLEKDDGAFAKVLNAVNVLGGLYKGRVFPQFTRMNANESELEQFYRYWHDKSSPSQGNVIIQKFDHACRFFSDERPADLSPLLRYPCWHIKRDMSIFGNGDVPLCRENGPFAKEGIAAGNVFEKPLDEIWNSFMPYVKEQIEKKYGGKCGNCDEYYTFNF